MAAKEEDKLNIRKILSATIASLCNNGLDFNLELRIEGLIGITIDKNNVFLVNINEVLHPKKSNIKKPSSSSKSCDFQSKNQNSTNETNKTIKKEPHIPEAGNKDDIASDSSQVQKVKDEYTKIVSERLETECLSMQQHGGGYAEVQKSVKTVQHPEGMVEQKQVEWKTYDADGRVLEHKKVEAVQTVAQSLPDANCDPQYVNSNMNNHYNAQDSQIYDSQEYYYPNHGFADYTEEYGNGSNYFNQQSGFDDNFQSDTYSVRGKKRGGKRGARGRGSSRAAPNVGNQTTHVKRGKTLGKNSRQQFKQPPLKKKCFQQHFQGHYPSPPPQGSHAPPQSAKRTQPGKDLLKRAVMLVMEGKVSRAGAANLFGISKGALEKELSQNHYSKEVGSYQDEDYDVAGEWAEDVEYSGYEGYM